ncbi:MlaD family protein [Mycobacterium intracellulare]|uniref:MlaD family protein n=1 Tax=Mycobacterium intracellulare TaxID=1767 RepID=UPI00080B85FB|nr:MlaD family protein [Mycobacterium intracellulare]OCB17823.1 mammalian cell entry protein [Mycobacterium intracellulare subsp. yongonense]
MVKHLAALTAFCAMIVGLVGYVGSLGIRVAPPANRTNLSMNVSNVNNLVVDSNVLLRGVPVGKVDGIDASLAHATIHFYIDNTYKVPVDSVVRLENLSALGESYVELEPRSAGGPVFRDGQVISTESVKKPASISELAVSVVRVLNQLDPGELERVVGEADTALPDPNAVLPNLQRASLLLHNTTTDLHGRGRQVLDNLQSLLENAGFVGPALADAAPSVRGLGPEIHRLWNEATNIVIRDDSPGNVYIFGKFLQRIQKLLDDRAPDIRVLTEPLMANVVAIGASLKTIDTSQVLTNLMAAVPADGVIELHVTNEQR